MTMFYGCISSITVYSKIIDEQYFQIFNTNH